VIVWARVILFDPFKGYVLEDQNGKLIINGETIKEG